MAQATFDDAYVTVASGFTNDGTIELTSLISGNAELTVSSGSLVNAVGGQINVLVGAGGFRSLFAQLDNRGTLTLNQTLTLNKTSADHLNSGTITLSGGDLAVIQSGTTPTFTTTGTIDIPSGRTFYVGGGTLNYDGGTIGGAGTVSLEGMTANFTPDFTNQMPTTLLLISTTLNGLGKVTNPSGSTLSPVASTINAALVNQGMLLCRRVNIFNGSFENQAGATLRLVAQATFDDAYVTVASGFTNGGTIELTSLISGNAELTVSSGSLVNAVGGQINVLAGAGGSRSLFAQLDNRGTLTLNQTLTLTKGSADHLNSGLITLSGGDLSVNQSGTTPTFTNSGTINIGSNRTFAVTAGRLDNIVPGTIQGNGTLDVSTSTFLNAANVNPGASPGRLGITGNYTQNASGTLNIEVTGTNAVTDFDLLAVTGTANLAGTLNVTVADGFTAPIHTKLLFLTANPRSAQFNTFLFSSSQFLFRTNYLANGVELEVIPPPLVINPLSVTLVSGETQTFTASGGVPPYTFSVAVNNSGGNINSSGGLYTAGPVPNVTDTVRVTDSDAATATASVSVTPNAFRVSGHVRDGSGIPIANATVSLSPLGLTLNTDPGGGYSFEQVPRGANITVSVSRSGFTFSPDQSFNNLNADLVADFTGDSLFRRVSGRVADASGFAIANATVTILSPIGLTMKTDAGGFYSFQQVPRGANITVSVSKTSFTFSPDQSFNNLNADQVANFTGTVILRSISGFVRNPSGQGVGGVKVTLLKNKQTVFVTTFTLPTGQFNAVSLPANVPYEVIPSKLNSSFSPVSRTVSLLQNNGVADFTIVTSFVISGRLTDPLGNGIAGATVKFATSGSGQTIASAGPTSPSGAYASPLLPPGTYVVRPSKPNFLFTSASVSIVNANVNRNFTGSKALISVSGRVTNATGGRFAGMEMILTSSGGANLTNMTASDGSFAFNNLQGNLTYTLTPSRANFVFSPPSFTFTGLDSIRSFRATPVLPLTGRIAAKVFNGSSYDFLVMNADGTEQVRFASPYNDTSDFRFGRQVELSPDGRKIAFVDGGLFVMNSDGSGRRRLTANGFDVLPAWSPNSLKLSYLDPNEGLKIIDADGSHAPVTVVPGSYGSEPEQANPSIREWIDGYSTWSPDGTELLFGKESQGFARVFRVGTNGTFLRMVNGLIGVGPAWSPNGNKFAYLAGSPNTITYAGNELYVANLDGTGEQLLSEEENSAPAWSPDGSMIAGGDDNLTDLMLNLRSGGFGIYARKADGSLKTAIAFGELPSWGRTPSVPTASGSDVTISSGRATVNFFNVTTPGTTMVVPAPPALSGALPPGYVSIDGADLNYEVSTTAGHSGPMTLCFSVNITSERTFNSLRIMHGENGALVDCTILPASFLTKTICGQVTSLSPFAIAMLVDPVQPSVSGVVADADGNPIPDIKFELGGGDSLQASSDIEGQFTFANLAEGTNYTIVPLDDRYDFTPPMAILDEVTGTNALAFIAVAKRGLTLTIIPDPAIAGRFILTWPVPLEEYVLESTGSLSSPNWTPVLEPLSNEGDNFMVSVQGDATPRFFRLRRQ